jgi:hypothetical protein
MSKIILSILISKMGEIEGLGWYNDADMKLPFDKVFKFYQLCQFAGIDNKHEVRVFFYKSPGKYLDIKKYKITKDAYKRFIKNTPLRYFKTEMAYDLDDIPYPLNGEVLMAKMITPSILTQKNGTTIDYSSYRTFNKEISFN